MSKITLSFMQRFMTNLDASIKAYFVAKSLPQLETNTSGTYVLKAVNSGGTTTYTWIPVNTATAYMNGTTAVLPSQHT